MSQISAVCCTMLANLCTKNTSRPRGTNSNDLHQIIFLLGGMEGVIFYSNVETQKLQILLPSSGLTLIGIYLIFYHFAVELLLEFLKKNIERVAGVRHI